MAQTMLNRGAGRQARPGAALALAIAIALPISPAAAEICDGRWPQLQFARDDLQRAVSEGDLASAQDFAERARREFDQLATLATRCGCPPAATQFEGLARHVRQIQDAESRKELREMINAAKPLLEAALGQLQDCRKR